MRNEEILKKAVEKALKNGYKAVDGRFIVTNGLTIKTPYFAGQLLLDYYSVIFSHDFAKAFWGEDKIATNKMAMNGEFDAPTFYIELNWQVHLQRMVLESNPLKYLEKFL